MPYKNKNDPIVKMKIKVSMWKFKGLISDDYESVYNRWLVSERCENCNKPYTVKNCKCMDHCHDTGVFRNILCNPCNVNKNESNTSGIPNICWDKNRNHWVYQRTINGKYHSKCSKDLKWLKQYKIDYEQEHYY